jgi:hypothetical protein
MQSTKPRSLLAMAAGIGMTVMASQPTPAQAPPHPWFEKTPMGHPKGRSNNKPGARLKERDKAKAAHKARMKQKRKK